MLLARNMPIEFEGLQCVDVQIDADALVGCLDQHEAAELVQAIADKHGMSPFKGIAEDVIGEYHVEETE